MRSWLFAPGDSERKLAKLGTSGADAVIADLEDAVLPEAKGSARAMVAEWLQSLPSPVAPVSISASNARAASTSAADVNAPLPQRWVRINALETAHWREDLAVIMGSAPDGILLPKSTGPEQLRIAAQELHAQELRHNLEPGQTRIVPLVSETAYAALSIARYADCGIHRLHGITWGAEDLTVALGASRKRNEQGEWTDAFRYVRTQVLLTARACNALPIDTLYADFRDLDGLAAHAKNAFADGFAGMMAIHPAQVPVINACFTPAPDMVAEAQAIIDAFGANPGVGAVQLNGRMIDLPHLEQAQRLLAEHSPRREGPAR